MENTTKTINLDFTKANAKVETASLYDADLMRITCFGTHEGKNENGLIFPRTNLVVAARTFVDKPLIIVPDRNGLPSGHGFDFKNKTFDLDKRVNVGHITDAYPVFVDSNDEIVTQVWDIEMLTDNQFAECELRIVTELVVYKSYYSEIAERLEFLHSVGNLSFSMEALVSSYETDDNGKVCTDIMFTGLAIVDKPAFVNSKSIAVSEKEDEGMNFEEMYNSEKAKNETLVAEKATIQAELDTAKNDLTENKTNLANVTAELAEAKATIETLKPYKEQVEAAEKEALGKDRLAKLEKLGVKDLDVAELAEKTKEEFADMLIEAAEKYVPTVAGKEDDKEAIGLPQHDTGMKSDKEKLLEALNKL